MEPGLLWGNQQIVNDMQGAYYRANYQSRQWQLDGGVDYATPVSGAYRGSTYLTGNARYQVSRDWGLGLGNNVRQGLSDAWFTFAFTDNQNAWGSTRLQVKPCGGYRSSGIAAYPGSNLAAATVISPEHRRFTAARAKRLRLLQQRGAIRYGGGDLGNNVTVRHGNIQWNSKAGSLQGPSTYVNVGVNWRFLPNWMASVFAYENNATVWRPLVVDSPIMNPDLTETQKWNDRGVFLSLRYEFNAGRSAAPLGGLPGDGAGRVTGIIYFDQNDDGRMNSGEQGVANLTVILNGKFVTRTDSTGRFEFPQVRSGQQCRHRAA